MERFLLAWIQAVIVYRRHVVAALLALTVLAAWQASHLEINSSPYVVDVSHPVRQAQAAAGEHFSAMGEQALVVLERREGDIFNTATIARIDALSRAFARLSLGNPSDLAWVKSICGQSGYAQVCASGWSNGLGRDDRTWLKSLHATLAKEGRDRDARRLEDLMVRLFPVVKVRSLTTVEDLYIANQDTFMTEPLITDIHVSASGLAALRERALQNDLYRGLLLSRDARATTIQVELSITGDDTANMLQAYQAINRVIAATPGAEKVYLGGVPVINSEIAQVMESDNKTFLPFVVLTICFMLYLSFRQLQGMVLPLLVAIITLVWTLGIMAVLGIRQNIVTTMLPIFIMAISVSDAIHYLSNYYLAARHQVREKAVMSAFRELILALLMTSLTTIAGFLSLAYTDIISVREFGLLVALGVFLAFVVTVLLFPAVLPMLPVRDYPVGKASGYSRWIHLPVRRPRSVLLGSALLACGLLMLAMSLRVDNHSSAGFGEDSRFRHDDAAINRVMGGTFPVNFLLASTDENAFRRPDTLQALERIQERLERFESVGYSVSPVDFVKRIHQVLRNEPAALPSPLTPNVISQYYFLYENSNGQDLRTVLDESGRRARLAVLFHTDQASEFKRVIDETLIYARTVLPADVSITAAGYGAEIVVATDSVVNGQISSIAISAVLIAVMLAAMYRSVVVGLLAMVPLVFTLLANFAVMAASRTPLDIGTALIAGITFGIGIDYAIHFISALKRHRQQSPLSEEGLVAALTRTLDEVTRPVLVNSLALAMGFILLALSDFAPIRQTGYFVAMTMVLSALSVLVILPALIRVLRPCAIENSAIENSAIENSAIENSVNSNAEAAASDISLENS